MNEGEILLVEDNPDDAELTRIAFAEADIPNPLVVVRAERLFGSPTPSAAG